MNCRRIACTGGGATALHPETPIAARRTKEIPSSTGNRSSPGCPCVGSLRSDWLYPILDGTVSIVTEAGDLGREWCVTVASAGCVPRAGTGRVRAGAELRLRLGQGALPDVPSPPRVPGMRFERPVAERALGRDHRYRAAVDPSRSTMTFAIAVLGNGRAHRVGDRRLTGQVIPDSFVGDRGAPVCSAGRGWPRWRAPPSRGHPRPVTRSVTRSVARPHHGSAWMSEPARRFELRATPWLR